MSVLVNDSGAVRVGCLEPNEVSSLALDFDPFSLILNDNDLVTTLTDVVQSATLNTTNNAEKPFFKKNKLNGYPILEFMQFNVLRNATNIIDVMQNDYTLFFVLNLKNILAIGNIFASISSPAGGESGGGFDLFISSEKKVRYREYSANMSAITTNATSEEVLENGYVIFSLNVKRGGNFYIRTSLKKRNLVTNNTAAFTRSTKAITEFALRNNELEFIRLLMFNQSLSENIEIALFSGLKLKYKI